MFVDRLLNGRVVLGAALGALVGLAALAGSDRASAQDATVSWAQPTTATSTVNVGDSVTWNWADALPHSVVSLSGPGSFDSGVLTGAGQTFSFEFTQAGTYTYQCSVHGPSMTGTVTVQAAASPTASPTGTAVGGPGTATTTPAGGATATPGSPSVGSGFDDRDNGLTTLYISLGVVGVTAAAGAAGVVVLKPRRRE